MFPSVRINDKSKIATKYNDALRQTSEEMQKIQEKKHCMLASDIRRPRWPHGTQTELPGDESINETKAGY